MVAQAIAGARKGIAVQVGRLALLIGAALAITNLGLPQWITGPLVNALLFLTVGWCGVSQAIVIGMVTPLGAAARGVLPLSLWAMIVFIALGNAALVSTFSRLGRYGRWLPIVVASVAKLAILVSAVTLLVARPLSIGGGGASQTLSIPVTIVNMMTWPQLATALAGGVIALGVQTAARRGSRKG